MQEADRAGAHGQCLLESQFIRTLSATTIIDGYKAINGVRAVRSVRMYGVPHVQMSFDHALEVASLVGVSDLPPSVLLPGSVIFRERGVSITDGDAEIVLDYPAEGLSRGAAAARLQELRSRQLADGFVDIPPRDQIPLEEFRHACLVASTVLRNLDRVRGPGLLGARGDVEMRDSKLEIIVRSIGTWDLRDAIAAIGPDAHALGSLDLLDLELPQMVRLGGFTFHVSHFLESAAPLTEPQQRAADELIAAGRGCGHEGRDRRATAMLHRLTPDGGQRELGRST